MHVEDSRAPDAAARPKPSAAKEIAELDWHLRTQDEVLQGLSVSMQSGLDSAQVERRLKQYGPNHLTERRKNWLLK